MLLYYPVIVAGNEDTNEVIRKVKEHLEAKERAKDSMFDLLQSSQIWEVFTSLAASFPQYIHLTFIQIDSPDHYEIVPANYLNLPKYDENLLFFTEITNFSDPSHVTFPQTFISANS